MASQQLQLAVAGSQCELPLLNNNNLRRSATEAQLGLDSELELRSGFEFEFELKFDLEFEFKVDLELKLEFRL